MKWRKFDKKVKNELASHQSEVDIDAIWGAIEPAVDAINEEKKKKRRGIFWWFFGAILLAGIGFGIFVLNNEETQSSANLIIEKNISEDSNDINFNKKEVAKAAENVLTNNEKSVNKPLTDFEKSDTKKSASPIQREEIANSSFAEEQENNFAKNLSESTTFEEVENLNKTQNIEFTATVTSDDSDNFDGSKNEEVTVSQPINSTILQKNVEKGDKNNLFQLPVDWLKSIEHSSTILERKTLTKKEERAIKKPIKEALAEQKKCAEKKVNTSIGLYSGVGFANRNLMTKNDSTTNDLQQLREDTERNLETFQLGLQVNIEHKKTGFGLTTGLNYTQINERFDYNRVLVEVDSIEGVEFIYRNVNGDTIETMGMLPRTITTTFTNRHYNKYQLVDIPVLLSYRKQFGQLSVGAQAGVFVNLRLKTSGRILQTESEILPIGDTDIFKSSVGLSYYFGATVDYHFSKNWSISAAPFVRYLSNDFANRNYSLKQKYTLVGLNLGLRYSF